MTKKSTKTPEVNAPTAREPFHWVLGKGKGPPMAGSKFLMRSRLPWQKTSLGELLQTSCFRRVFVLVPSSFLHVALFFVFFLFFGWFHVARAVFHPRQTMEATAIFRRAGGAPKERHFVANARKKGPDTKQLRFKSP